MGFLIVSVRARRLGGDAAKSAGALILLLIVLVAVDERVQEQVAKLLNAEPTSTVSGLAARMREIGTVLFDAARTQSLEQAPLLIFVVITTILVLWMFRT